MHPIVAISIAQARTAEMQATAATERLAASLRHDRPRRAALAGVAIAGLVGRIRDTASATRHTAPSPTPCTSC